MSSRWLYYWKCFVQNRVTASSYFEEHELLEWAETVPRSDNPEIGILPPGPISNHLDLFVQTAPVDERSGKSLPLEIISTTSNGSLNKLLKAGLRVNIHYKAVSPYVWYLLQVNYQGGPSLVREAIDIYSQDMQRHLNVYQGKGVILPAPKLQTLRQLKD